MSGRTKVSRAIKRQLIEEAGGKCANPGCPSVLTELHHIREWHVYRTHDPDHMIAICPSCHDAVDRGTLRVTDEIAYAWKAIIRKAGQRGHLYVEPNAMPPRLLLGTLTAQGSSGLVVFSQEDRWHLSFRLVGVEIMHMSAQVSAVDGRPLVRVNEGHYEIVAADFAGTLAQRSGRFQVHHPLAEEVMPRWAIEQVRRHEPEFALDGSLPLLDMHVLAPNLVRVQGVWMMEGRGMVITEKSLHIVDESRPSPISLQGEGLESVISYTGPADQGLFAFAGRVDP